MANYTISFVAQDHIDVYCENICTGKCYNAVTSNKDNSEVKIMQEGPCYKVFCNRCGSQLTLVQSSYFGGINYTTT